MLDLASDATASKSARARISVRADWRSSAISAARTAGGGEVVDVLEAVVAQPQQVEAGLVAGDQLVVGVALEALGLLAAVAVCWVVAGGEVVEVGSGEGVLLEGEVLVGAQVIDPQLAGLGGLGTLAAAEEQHVGLHSLGVQILLILNPR